MRTINTHRLKHCIKNDIDGTVYKWQASIDLNTASNNKKTVLTTNGTTKQDSIDKLVSQLINFSEHYLNKNIEINNALSILNLR